MPRRVGRLRSGSEFSFSIEGREHQLRLFSEICNHKGYEHMNFKCSNRKKIVWYLY